MAKADLKKVETAWREEVGRAIDRALSLAHLTQKEAWVLLGHNDGAQLSRWIKGTERPQFDVLFSVAKLRQPLVIALAGLVGSSVVIETNIRLTA